MRLERLEELLWERIDGTIDAADQVELEAFLAEDLEARELSQELTVLAKRLAGVREVAPPAALRERIDRALADATSPPSRTGTDHPTTTTHIHPAPPWTARWLPLAAALLIGVTAGYLLHPGAAGSIDRSRATGAMLTSSAQSGVEPVEVYLDAGIGSVSASRGGADVVIDVVLTAEINLGVTLAGAAGPVRFAGLNSANAAATEVSTEHGWVVAQTHGPGTVTLSVSAADADDTLKLVVSIDGAPVAKRWIGPTRIELEP